MPEFLAVIEEQKFLVARVPQARELVVYQDGRQNGHLIFAVGRLAKFGGAAVFLDAREPRVLPTVKPSVCSFSMMSEDSKRCLTSHMKHQSNKWRVWMKAAMHEIARI